MKQSSFSMRHLHQSLNTVEPLLEVSRRVCGQQVHRDLRQEQQPVGRETAVSANLVWRATSQKTVIYRNCSVPHSCCISAPRNRQQLTCCSALHKHNSSIYTKGWPAVQAGWKAAGQRVIRIEASK
jgi:hypothetical protein